MQTFKNLDKNCDGYLSKTELIDGFIKIFKNTDKAKKEVEKIMNNLKLSEND